MQTLEELAKKWNKFVFTSIAAASLWMVSADYLSSRNNQEEVSIDEVEYTYRANDGFELSTRAGEREYNFDFRGACRDSNHWLSFGEKVSISNLDLGRFVSIYDYDCDGEIDLVSSSNGSCTNEVDRRVEPCNLNTYEEATYMFNEAEKILKVKEFRGRYNSQRYNHSQLPEDQTKRLLDGLRKFNP